MQRILIAGAGYLGLALAERLAQDDSRKHEVFLARRSAQPLPKAKTIACDFTDPASLKALPEVDAIYYAVAADDASENAYEKAYWLGVRNLIDHYHHRSLFPRFFLSSSTSAYSAKNGEEVSENSALTTSGPSRFIVAGEKLLLDSGFDGAVLRYGGIYGPGRGSFVRRIRDGLEPLMPNAKQYTNRIHRDDAAGIVAFLLSLKASGMAILNAVDARSELRDDVIRWILGELGKDIHSYPMDGTAEVRRGHKRVLSDRLKGLGYSYLYPSFREGYPSIINDEIKAYLDR